MAESLLTGLVVIFHCACGSLFLSGICKLKPKKPKKVKSENLKTYFKKNLSIFPALVEGG